MSLSHGDVYDASLTTCLRGCRRRRCRRRPEVLISICFSNAQMFQTAAQTRVKQTNKSWKGQYLFQPARGLVKP